MHMFLLVCTSCLGRHTVSLQRISLTCPERTLQQSAMTSHGYEARRASNLPSRPTAGAAIVRGGTADVRTVEPAAAGAIPESLALHPALEALDVSRNMLTRLPALWTEGASAGTVANAALRNVRLSSNSFSVRARPVPHHSSRRKGRMLLRCAVHAPGWWQELRCAEKVSAVRFPPWAATPPPPLFQRSPARMPGTSRPQ